MSARSRQGARAAAGGCALKPQRRPSPRGRAPCAMQEPPSPGPGHGVVTGPSQPDPGPGPAGAGRSASKPSKSVMAKPRERDPVEEPPGTSALLAVRPSECASRPVMASQPARRDPLWITFAEEAQLRRRFIYLGCPSGTKAWRAPISVTVCILRSGDATRSPPLSRRPPSCSLFYQSLLFSSLQMSPNPPHPQSREEGKGKDNDSVVSACPSKSHKLHVLVWSSPSFQALRGEAPLLAATNALRQGQVAHQDLGSHSHPHPHHYC